MPQRNYTFFDEKHCNKFIDSVEEVTNVTGINLVKANLYSEVQILYENIITDDEFEEFCDDLDYIFNQCSR